jgi:hypothetical protein
MFKGLLATGAACALVGGVAVAGHAAQTPSGAASPVALTAAAPAAAAPAAAAAAAAEADQVTGTTAGKLAGKLTRKQRCELLPGRIARTQKLEKTLAAEASTQGSIAYLKARIAKAEAAHDDTLVARLTARLQFRTALQGFLPQRLELLKTAQTTICAVK